jgi:hypothetical protein
MLTGRVSFEDGDIGKPILEEMRPSSSLTGMFSDRLLTIDRLRGRDSAKLLHQT